MDLWRVMDETQLFKTHAFTIPFPQHWSGCAWKEWNKLPNYSSLVQGILAWPTTVRFIFLSQKHSSCILVKAGYGILLGFIFVYFILGEMGYIAMGLFCFAFFNVPQNSAAIFFPQNDLKPI